jgi:RimJ/RimL family protein N-acetyltransferase
LILAGHDQEVIGWVASRIKHFNVTEYSAALGLLDSKGRLVAGVVYDNFRGYDINMHIAAIPGGKWLNREFLREGFRYPFLYLGVERITGLVAASNVEAQRFDEHLGFVLEGRVRKGLPDGDDLLVYGMLKSECRFLHRKGLH